MPRTNYATFTLGNTGHTYVRSHLQNFLVHGFIREERRTDEDHIEGADSIIYYCRFGEEVNSDTFQLENVGITNARGFQIVSEEIGGLEVKTVDQYIFRNNDQNEATGTIPFELWSDKERTRLGWLLALIRPDIRLHQEDDQPIHAVQPILLCFLLCSYTGPFACCMFENIPALPTRSSGCSYWRTSTELG